MGVADVRDKGTVSGCHTRVMPDGIDIIILGLTRDLLL